MTIPISFIDLSLEGLTQGLYLEFEAGMTALFTTSAEHEIRLLARTLTGEQLPEQGCVQIDGVPLAERTRSQLHQLRRSAGVVPANGGLISNLKLWDNITLPLLFHGGSVPEESHALIHAYLEQFGLGNNLWTLPGHLNQFERRAVGFIRAAVTKPRFMLYAGCFDNLPSQEKTLLLEHALKLHTETPGMISLFITSSLTSLEQLEPDLNCNLRHNPAVITRNG